MRIAGVQGADLDGLTLFVRMLDAFVLFVQGAGAAAMALAAAFLMKLLPGRIRKAVTALIAVVAAVALLSGSWLSMFMVTAIKFGIWAVAAIVAFEVVLFAVKAKRSTSRVYCVAHGEERDLAGNVGGTEVFAKYLSSCLRKTQVFLN